MEIQVNFEYTERDLYPLKFSYFSVLPPLLEQIFIDR